MTRRIGIYSGTFDPIHEGHIAFALAAQQACSLDEVVFVPEPQPRGKTGVTDLVHRTAMIQRAIGTHPKLRAVTLRSSRFTLNNTLPELQHIFADAELSLLMGSDIARNLHLWQGLEKLSDVQLIIGLRQHDTKEELTSVVHAVTSPYDIRFALVPARAATAHASSSTARSGDVGHLPAGVRQYIQQNNLYS
jgi:nicotinate-nucleotide adenylyltransferase